MYWPRTIFYLTIWCVTFPSWLTFMYLFGPKHEISIILLALNFILGPGVLMGINLSKGLRADPQLAIVSFMVPVQPFFMLLLLVLPSAPRSELSQCGSTLSLMRWIAFILCLISIAMVWPWIIDRGN